MPCHHCGNPVELPNYVHADNCTYGQLPLPRHDIREGERVRCVDEYRVEQRGEQEGVVLQVNSPDQGDFEFYIDWPDGGSFEPLECIEVIR
jgi:hypothetical protein